MAADGPTSDAARAIETVARQCYGRLVAYLTRQSRDLAAAEDALADAFAKALEIWPRRGLPASPEAWLLTAARNRLVDRARHACVVEAGAVSLMTLADAAVDMLETETPLPDWRLELLFVAAHPAIDPAIHTPLMLQVVLGLDAATIAAAFLVAPATMGQRLSRAKARIRDAGIGFTVPARAELPERLEAVLAAIYAAFSTGWDGATDGEREGLCHEAIALARVLNELMPDEPEILGLLALMLHAHARRAARRGFDGAYIPLDRQDVTLWDPVMIREAEALLACAGAMGRPGRFQLEAAIQSVHAARRETGETDENAIVTLYAGLMRIAPSLGAAVGQAAALLMAGRAEDALAALELLPAERIAAYQPYWATRAEALARLGRGEEARKAFERAIGLASDPAIRAHLHEKSRALASAGSLNSTMGSRNHP